MKNFSSTGVGRSRETNFWEGGDSKQTSKSVTVVSGAWVGPVGSGSQPAPRNCVVIGVTPLSPGCSSVSPCLDLPDPLYVRGDEGYVEVFGLIKLCDSRDNSVDLILSTIHSILTVSYVALFVTKGFTQGEYPSIPTSPRQVPVIYPL